jgi:multidrug efflux system membrane fusion protein
VLILLDAGDFEARARQAQANLARNEALLARARTDVERYVALQARGFVSEEKVHELRTTAAAAAASVKADQAALELARRQLSYTTIRAPFTGVVGARLVFPGSAVKLNETVLAVVNRVQPLYVTFSVAEKYLPRLRSAMRKGSCGADHDPRRSASRASRSQATVGFIDNSRGCHAPERSR